MEADKIKALDKAHHMHSWSVQSQLNPLVFDHGEGAVFWDKDGKRYLDFSSQLVNLNTGHQHPAIVDAIKEWADKCAYIGPAFAYESRSMLIEKMVKITPDNINHFFFTLGGAESNENAVKMARQFTGKHKIISRYRSYHGASAGAIALTGDPRRWPTEPGMAGVIKVLDPYCYRCPFGLEYPSCDLQCAEHVHEVMTYEGALNSVAAMVVEGVTGTNGVFVPPQGYYERLREICDEFDVLLVVDEVMSGFGRTGKWFAFQNWDVKPDIITMAKGLTSGYMPLGCVAVSDKIAEHFDNNFLSCGLTYNAHPISCGAACACLDIYEQENLMEKALSLGDICRTELKAMQEKYQCVGDARGLGLFWVLELVKDKATKEPLSAFNTTSELAGTLMAELTQKGVSTFLHWHKLFITPPLVITEDELKEGLGIIDEALASLEDKL